MKIAIIVAVIILLIASAFLNANQSIELKVGDEAPEFSLYDQDNKLHNLSDYKGQR